MKSKYLLSRVSNVSLLLVLLVLTGFSFWAASLNQQASIAVQESELYRQITYTLSTEESTQYEYVLRPSTALENEHFSDATTLIALLQRLQQDGNPDDVTLARQVSTEEPRYLLLSGQFFAAVDAHNLALAQTLHYQEIDPVFDRIQQQLLQKADEEQVAATSAMGRLSQAQQIAFTIMPIMFVLGLLLLIFSGVMTRNYRRKIDQAVQAEKTRSKQLTVTDSLTNLGNHSAYQERLSQALGEIRREGKKLVLVLLDIDQFKVFNDQQGHQRGDEVLLAFAALLHEARLSDFLYRLGSDDFALIVPQAALADTTLTLERFREDVERHAFGITVSIGLASASSHESDRELLHAQAAAALQEAKRQGRNRVLTFDAIAGNVSIISSTKIQALRCLLSDGKMTIAFQPIWDLATGTVAAFEALARPEASYGFAGPQEMFDIAEQIGRAHELDVICIQAILARAAELPAGVLLFMNLTPQTLVHDLLSGATLLEAVVSAGLIPARVVLEITERSIVHIEEVVQKVKFLRLMGFRVALDDAGAGNAGLEMLSQLSVDFVKIDRAIVIRALTDQSAHGVLTGITAMAHESDISVVAEGIETSEMLEMVQRLKVQCAQGYLLGRPSEIISDETSLQRLSPLRTSHSDVFTEGNTLAAR